MTRVHPTAIVHPESELAADVEVGPYTVIEAGVTIAAGNRIGPYVHIQGRTEMGPDNFIGTGTQLGLAPQHLAYEGGPRRLVIGSGNTLREYSSVHGSYEHDGATRIGDGCYIMGQCHIGHDVVIEDGVVVSNGAYICGHAHIGSRSVISGPVGVHQFVRVGRLCMLSSFARVGQDVPPFLIAEGHPTFLRGLNVIGLRRAGIEQAVRTDIKRTFKALYRSGRPIKEALAELQSQDLSPESRELVEFHRPSKRGVTPFSAYRSHTTEAG